MGFHRSPHGIRTWVAGSFSFLLFAVALLMFWAAPMLAWGQLYHGSIIGVVQDTQKSVIPHAQLALTNEETGITRTITTGGKGQFNFSNLNPGRYTLTSKASGFSASIQKHIQVGVGGTVSLTVTLSPGKVTQTVTVNGNAAHLQTQTSEISTTITPEEMEHLPTVMEGDMQNPEAFVFLVPGVYGSTPGATPDYRLHISGSVSDSNAVYIDGIPDMSTTAAGQIGDTHPPLSAISQFKMINNNEGAQYGYASGIVSFEFKSGTNKFHGGLSDYTQNTALNAAGYVTDRIRSQPECQVSPLPSQCQKAPLTQQQYGGSLGGPVLIPRVYNGRNKTFFFFDWTGFKYRPSSNNATLTTIPNEFRKGNFSQQLGPQLTVKGQPIFDPAGRPIYSGEVYNPFSVSTVTGPNGQSYQVRNPFPGNVIPPSLISKVSQNIVKYFPQADSDALTDNFVRQQSSITNEHRWVLKIDEHISSRNSLSGSLFAGTGVGSNNGGLTDYSSGGQSTPTLQVRLNYAHTFSATALNNLNIGFIRSTLVNGPLVPGPGLAALGLTGLPPLDKQSAFPTIGIGTAQNALGGGGGTVAANNRYVINDNLMLVRGNNELNIGGDVRWLQRNEKGLPSGSFTFEPTESGLNGVGFINGNQPVDIPEGTGAAAASFLLGGMDFVQFSYPVEMPYRWWAYGAYIQDNWRVTPHLTLNLGMRYDLQIPRTVANGDASTMDPTLPNPDAGGIPGAFTFYGHGPGRNGKARIGTIGAWGFQPRIGFAYSPQFDPKTVFRGGFSVIRPTGNDLLENGISTGEYNPGFAGSAVLNRSSDYLGDPAYYWDNSFPSSAVILPGSQLNPGQDVGNINAPMIRPDAGIAPTQIYWSFQVQHQLTPSVIFNIGYVGMHTYHLGMWSKPNQINPVKARAKYGPIAKAEGVTLPQLLTSSINSPLAAAAGVTAPWPGFVAAFGSGATIGQALRPWPQYGDVDDPMNPIGSDEYDAMQTSVQKRFSHGLTFLVSYTFSKTIGDVDSNNGPTAGAENAIFAGSFFQNYYDSKAEHTVTSSDIPQVLSISYTYQLPFGPGKPFLHGHGIVGKLAGGWSVAGIQQYQSGRPIHIEYDAVGANNPFFAAGDGFSFRPNLVPGVPLKNPAYRSSCSGPLFGPGRKACQFYINPAAFSAPPVGTFGDAPNLFGDLRMPPYFNENFSFIKNLNLPRNFRLQFQANLFNAFNRVVLSSGGNAQTFIFNAAPPSLSSTALANSSTVFGIMTAQQNGPRVIQLGAKLRF